MTINELEKLQNDASTEQYAYIDATSKLIIKKFNANKSCVMPFVVAAEEGLVWEAESGARGYTFVYTFSGEGSVKFVGTSDVAAHKIAAAAIELGSGDGKEIRSKKLIAFNSEKSNVTVYGFADGATITTDDSKVAGVVKNEAVTTSDPVGTCSLRKADDGIYLDYVARSDIKAGPTNWNEVEDGDVAKIVTDLPTGKTITATELADWAKANDVAFATDITIPVNALIFNVAPDAAPTTEATAEAAAAEILKDYLEDATKEIGLTALLKEIPSDGKVIDVEGYPMATIKLIPSTKLQSTDSAKFFQLLIELR